MEQFDLGTKLLRSLMRCNQKKLIYDVTKFTRNDEEENHHFVIQIFIYCKCNNKGGLQKSGFSGQNFYETQGPKDSPSFQLDPSHVFRVYFATIENSSYLALRRANTRSHPLVSGKGSVSHVPSLSDLSTSSSSLYKFEFSPTFPPYTTFVFTVSSVSLPLLYGENTIMK